MNKSLRKLFELFLDSAEEVSANPEMRRIEFEIWLDSRSDQFSRIKKEQDSMTLAKNWMEAQDE